MHKIRISALLCNILHKLVFEQVFYEDSFKRGSRISSSLTLFAYLTKLFMNGNKNQVDI